MKIPAKINIIQNDGEMSAVYLGTIEYKPEGYYLEFEENENATCIIGYSKGVVSVTKTDGPVYTIVLEEESPYIFKISTPFGDLNASAHPIKIRSRTSKGVTTLCLIYDLVLGDQKIRHEMKIKIEPNLPKSCTTD